LIGGTVVAIPYTRLFLSTFEVRAATWFRRIILPNFPGPLVQTAVGLLTLEWVAGLHHLWQVAAICALSSALGLAVFAVFGLAREERRGMFGQMRSG
jgi:hypothetical protein